MKDHDAYCECAECNEFWAEMFGVLLAKLPEVWDDMPRLTYEPKEEKM